jgi:hypothetical protein
LDVAEIAGMTERDFASRVKPGLIDDVSMSLKLNARKLEAPESAKLETSERLSLA